VRDFVCGDFVVRSLWRTLLVHQLASAPPQRFAAVRVPSEGFKMSYILSQEKQIEVLRTLAEGSSVSSTSRLTAVARDTCTRLTIRFGEACRLFLDREMRDLECRHLEIDEMWTFCRKKQYNITGEEPDVDRIGDTYIFIALDEDSRLIPAFRVDKRNLAATTAFMIDLASRLKKPKPHASDAHAFKTEKYKPIVRISTDAFPPYPEAISLAFGPYAEYAQIKKRISKKEGVQITKNRIRGKIATKDITTSLVERSNLTTRTFLRRTTRKTLAYSKCLDNLRAATAIHLAVYNYCRRIRTTKETPAVRAGIAGKQFGFRELYFLLRETWPALFLLGDEKAA
jgi:hypothetical protein